MTLRDRNNRMYYSTMVYRGIRYTRCGTTKEESIRHLLEDIQQDEIHDSILQMRSIMCTH